MKISRLDRKPQPLLIFEEELLSDDLQREKKRVPLPSDTRARLTRGTHRGGAHGLSSTLFLERNEENALTLYGEEDVLIC